MSEVKSEQEITMKNGDSHSSKDPGAARYGNFINYYSFNPPENRMKNIPENFLSQLNFHGSELAVLDIGCNAGDLTAALFQFFSSKVENLRILGIDLDEKLIERALDNFSKVNENQKLGFMHLDIVAEDNLEKLNTYLSDIKRKKFDLVSIFSVTMWIHINHGDEGLIHFVKRICDVANNILVEPQPWKCYQTAARRARKLGKEEFAEMKNLKIRGQGVDQEIVDLFIKEGFKVTANFGESEWNRKLVLLQRSFI